MTKIEKSIFGSKGYQRKITKIKTTMSASELKKYQYDNMSEEEHQKLLVRWLVDKKIYFEIGLEGIFLPNPHPKDSKAFIIQANSNRRVLSKMKACGMKKGVSDIKVYLESINLHIELKKVSGGIISKEQKETHAIINKKKYCTHQFCYGFEDAKELISIYL